MSQFGDEELINYTYQNSYYKEYPGAVPDLSPTPEMLQRACLIYDEGMCTNC